MSQRTKSKRKVNRSKRAKLNSQGFKVHSGFYLYIGKETSGGWQRGGNPAVRPELVEMVRDFFNKDPCIRKIEKHIDGLTMVYNKKNKLAGKWDYETRMVRIIDDGVTPIDFFRSVLIHEIIGHAFWDLSRKWRREELIAFNKLANELPPVSSYVKENEEQWKKWNDDNDDEKAVDKKWEEQTKIYGSYDVPSDIADEYQKLYDDLKENRKTNGHYTMTRYANEQHSAITELVYGGDGHATLLDDENVRKLTELWEGLHY